MDLYSSIFILLFQVSEVENEDIAQSEEDGQLLGSTPIRRTSGSSITGISSGIPKRQKIKGPLAKQNELLSLACDFLSRPHNESQDQGDKYLDIAKVWAAKLKEMEPNQRLFAEKAINDILFEATLGNLQTDSVQRSNNSSNQVTPQSSPPNSTLYFDQYSENL